MRKEELRRKMEEERARSFHQQESQGFFKNRQYGQQREYRQNWGGPTMNDYNDKDEFERIKKENDERY